MGIVIAIDHGNFHIEGNDLKYTYSWESAHFSKSAGYQLYRSVHFISSLSFKNRTNSESWQNFLSMDVLNSSVALVQAKKWIETPMLHFASRDLY